MSKKVLVTAGSTQIKIDQVRVISNIFKGQTGAQIATYFQNQDDQVTLITSNPKLVSSSQVFRLLAYCTFDELAKLMEQEITSNEYDVIIHSAAVSDYKTAGVFVQEGQGLVSLDASMKISSAHNELFLKLIPTLKLIDLIRTPWGFQGFLVKFKLQVGLTGQDLIEIASQSLAFSQADLIVANCLEWAKKYAYIIDQKNQAAKTSRENLAAELYRRTR